MDYDRSIHNNPDAQAWAKFFIETTKDIDREVFSVEGYMTAWFSNAMMAMHYSMKPQETDDTIAKYVKACSDLSQQGIAEWNRAEKAVAKYKELREALRFYAEWGIDAPAVDAIIEEDRGDKARAALNIVLADLENGDY